MCLMLLEDQGNYFFFFWQSNNNRYSMYKLYILGVDSPVQILPHFSHFSQFRPREMGANMEGCQYMA